MEVFDFFARESEAFRNVVGFDVVDVDDFLRSVCDFEDVGRKAVVKTLKHLVEHRTLISGQCIFFDALNALDAHVLSDFHSVCTPWSDHFFSWADIFAF